MKYLRTVGWSLVACLLLCVGLVSSAERERDNRSKTAKPKTAVTQEQKADKSVPKPVQTASDATQTGILVEPALSPKQPMTGEQINWFVISSGATNASSTNYQLQGTIGQLAVGDASSTNYMVKSGYWQNFSSGGCCVNRGDVDHSGGNPDIADVTYLVAYAFKHGAAPPCLDEGDVDGSGGNPDIADVTYLVAYAFKHGAAPPPC